MPSLFSVLILVHCPELEVADGQGSLANLGFVKVGLFLRNIYAASSLSLVQKDLEIIVYY